MKALECKNCGAPLKHGKACEYCGTYYEWEPLLKIDEIEYVNCVETIQDDDGRCYRIGGSGGAGGRARLTFYY